MADVIQLFKHKQAKEVDSYVDYLKTLDKLELLEEMVRFQEERSSTGCLTPLLIAKGIPLFKALEQSAETPELRILTRAYSKHLAYEAEQLK